MAQGIRSPQVYLAENYSVLPEGVEDLCFGHVLHLMFSKDKKTRFKDADRGCSEIPFQGIEHCQEGISSRGKRRPHDAAVYFQVDKQGEGQTLPASTGAAYLRRLKKDVKYLKNDAAGRKAAVKKREIVRLRMQVRDLEDGKGLAKLRQVKWKHARLLVYNRSRKAEAVVEGNHSDLKAGGKVFGPDSRMMVYDLLVNSVPTKNIPIILSIQAERCGKPGTKGSQQDDRGEDGERA
ncbi:hypothetical protein CAPTEDRAFT_205873 [Capitella teleta]|uniref:Uncharacterized protein n=1 Tax=Capitella teleta TaxID=283909 RepID=R7U340_CAPTE|nr:hypothetical protein CAPTEDRAFT_205873 [Capitella teleta]|eukprot:ELT97595.1 hypothetical protein CAPTEDRAFT_205873 [Capitella teleta]